MAIKIPNKPQVGVAELRFRDSEQVFSIARVFKVDGKHEVQLVWEQTTFVDCNNKAFYDANGVPFQGAK